MSGKDRTRRISLSPVRTRQTSVNEENMILRREMDETRAQIERMMNLMQQQQTQLSAIHNIIQNNHQNINTTQNAQQNQDIIQNTQGIQEMENASQNRQNTQENLNATRDILDTQTNLTQNIQNNIGVSAATGNQTENTQSFNSMMRQLMQEREVGGRADPGGFDAALRRLHGEQNTSSEIVRPVHQMLSTSPLNSTQTLTHTQNNVSDTGTQRLRLGYTIKPDTYDGTTPYREFLNQFNFVALANQWREVEKGVILASCLRGKARSVLGNIDSINVSFKELSEVLELRFGDHQHGPVHFSLFQSRRQKPGESLDELVSDVERLGKLVFPTLSATEQDKIACMQFISSIYDINIKETLQLERITSLKVALSRAMEVKTIRDQNRKFMNIQKTQDRPNQHK